MNVAPSAGGKTGAAGTAPVPRESHASVERAVATERIRRRPERRSEGDERDAEEAGYGYGV